MKFNRVNVTQRNSTYYKQPTQNTQQDAEKQDCNRYQTQPDVLV